MGFFRRYKFNDFTADECREAMRFLENCALRNTIDADGMVNLMEEWGCFRELLARHEKNNKSVLDG